MRKNYDIAKIKARPFFMEKDQEKMIARYQLEHDSQYLYVTFLYDRYRILRETGAVEKETEDGLWMEANFEEVLSIYDLLGYAETRPAVSHTWTVVNSLPGVAQTKGLGDSFFSKYELAFSENEDGFIEACEGLGGKRVPYGDIGFVFQIFDELSILMKMYRADDEFNAQITLLWDYNTLNFVHYETTYYIARLLYENILKIIKK